MTYTAFDPIILELGPLAVRWYGLMYALGFLGFWWFGRVKAGRAHSGWQKEEIDDLLFYGAMGVVLGGRIGYILFYDTATLISDPLRLLRIWEGGMSYHGGMLGVFVAMWLYGRKTQRGFFKVTDFIAPMVPLGLGTGRIGNFINGELWGAPGDVPWAMRVSCSDFPYLCADKLNLPLGTQWTPPLHPNQLYEALLEGPILFAMLWFFAAKSPPVRAVSGLFMIGYGTFRFLIEFVRIPDAHLGYLAWNWVTMGQILSLPMILFGVWLMWWAYQEKESSRA